MAEVAAAGLSSPTLQLAQDVAAARQAGTKVLSASTPWFPELPIRLPALELDPRLSPSQGRTDCKALLAASLFQRWRARPDALVVTGGAKSALLCTFLALKRPGSRLICFAPTWPTYWVLAEAIGLPVAIMQRSLSRRWEIDLEQFRRETKPGDIVVVSNPCNPTGRTFLQEEISNLAAVCDQCGAWLILDESFSETVGADHPYWDHWPALGERVLVLNSVSKNYLAQGWRLGAIFCAGSVTATIAQVQTAMISPPASVLQEAAGFVVSRRGWFDALPELRHSVRAKLLAAGFQCAPGTGTFYIYPGKPGLAKAAMQVRDEHALYWLGGEAFGSDDHDCIRLCLMQPAGELDQIVSVLTELN
jgi:aspartate aminotransferase